MSEEKKCDAVFEGGGVKGIGLVGAVAATEAAGYTFENLAGTSAGAIVASLVASGYTAAELKPIMNALDYSKFKDRSFMDRIPLLGPAASVSREYGLYEGDYFADWLRDLLRKKGIRRFGDLVMDKYADDPSYRYKLQVIAADVSHGKLLVLPRDIAYYGIDPDDLEVVDAVRMSMSIPFFFEPVTLEDASGEKHYIVDGGVLSNFPVWLFDAADGTPQWPTFGYRLVEPSTQTSNVISSPISFMSAMFSTMMEAHDQRHIDDHDFARTIPVPTVGVRTTDFDLEPERSEALFQSGKAAGEAFFAEWDFEAYLAAHLERRREKNSER